MFTNTAHLSQTLRRCNVSVTRPQVPAGAPEARRYTRDVLELEVYAAGVRDLNKILELDQELQAIAGLRYKVDSNHDVVYLEMDEPTVTFREIRAIFRRLGLDPRFIGAIPAELRPKVKTQVLTP
jgi:hypothetical protein